MSLRKFVLRPVPVAIGLCLLPTVSCVSSYVPYLLVGVIGGFGAEFVRKRLKTRRQAEQRAEDQHPTQHPTENGAPFIMITNQNDLSMFRNILDSAAVPYRHTQIEPHLDCVTMPVNAGAVRFEFHYGQLVAKHDSVETPWPRM